MEYCPTEVVVLVCSGLYGAYVITNEDMYWEGLVAADEIDALPASAEDILMDPFVDWSSVEFLLAQKE